MKKIVTVKKDKQEYTIKNEIVPGCIDPYDSLFKCIKDIITLGYKITFMTEFLQLHITCSKDSPKGKNYVWSSSLPLQDHFNEHKLIEAIRYNISKIDKFIQDERKSIR